MADGWRCFHCGFLALSEAEAEKHFGPKRLNYDPACQGVGGMYGQRLRHEVDKFFVGLDSGAFKIATDQDETLARVLNWMRYCAKNYEASPKPKLSATSNAA